MHIGDLLLQAQVLGEILAIGHNRYYNKIWSEDDREVSFCLVTNVNGNRCSELGCIMIDFSTLLERNYLRTFQWGIRRSHSSGRMYCIEEVRGL